MANHVNNAARAAELFAVGAGRFFVIDGHLYDGLTGELAEED